MRIGTLILELYKQKVKCEANQNDKISLRGVDVAENPLKNIHA